jgi:site-specific DNA recombinase
MANQRGTRRTGQEDVRHALRRQVVRGNRRVAYLQGVAIPRKPGNEKFGGFWRATTVRQLLGNTVYKGLFIWNGSAFARAKAKKEHREFKTEEFKREHLRMVDDEIWTMCNTGQVSRARRGEGKHPFAGLITCGRCGAVLTVSQQQGSPADQARLGCARCQQAFRARHIKKGPPYLSAAGVRALLLHAFGHVVSGSFAEELRARLRTRRSADTELGLAAPRTELSRANFACRELTRKFSALSSANPYLEAQLDKKVAERHQLQQRVDELAAGRVQRDTARIQAQLDADIGKWLAKLLSPCALPERTRAVLSRAFPSIVVRKKLSHLVTLFEVTMVLGQVFAHASETNALDKGEVTLQFKVTSSAARPTKWTVDLV